MEIFGYYTSLQKAIQDSMVQDVDKKQTPNDEGLGAKNFTFSICNDTKYTLRNFTSCSMEGVIPLCLPQNIQPGHSNITVCDIQKAPLESIMSYRLQGTDIHIVTYYNINDRKFLCCALQEKDTLLQKMNMDATLSDNGFNRIQVTEEDLCLMNENAWQANGRTEKHLKFNGIVIKVVMNGSKFQVLITNDEDANVQQHAADSEFAENNNEENDSQYLEEMTKHPPKPGYLTIFNNTHHDLVRMYLNGFDDDTLLKTMSPNETFQIVDKKFTQSDTLFLVQPGDGDYYIAVWFNLASKQCILRRCPLNAGRDINGVHLAEFVKSLHGSLTRIAKQEADTLRVGKLKCEISILDNKANVIFTHFHPDERIEITQDFGTEDTFTLTLKSSSNNLYLQEIYSPKTNLNLPPMIKAKSTIQVRYPKRRALFKDQCVMFNYCIDSKGGSYRKFVLYHLKRGLSYVYHENSSSSLNKSYFDSRLPQALPSGSICSSPDNCKWYMTENGLSIEWL